MLTADRRIAAQDAAVLAAGVVVVGLLGWQCVRTHSPSIETDLHHRTAEALQANGIPSGGLTFSGRDAALTGPPGALLVGDRARQIAGAVFGVRSVEVRYTLADPPLSGNASVPPFDLPSVKAQREIVDILNKRSIEFIDGSAELTPAGRQAIDAVAAILAVYPGVKATIEGYTDSSGPPARNVDLSRRRSAAVKAYLAANGIAASRLSAAGFGPASPVAANDTPEGRQKNRRIEFRLSEGN